MKRWLWFLLLPALTARPATPRDLQVGIAGHAFDHLGGIGEQAEAAAASGSTLIYATGFGGDGYQGLPAPAELEARRKAVAAYVRQAKARGIRLALGYVCATSIVKLDTFDRHWTPELRSRFRRLGGEGGREMRREGREGRHGESLSRSAGWSGTVQSFRVR